MILFQIQSVWRFLIVVFVVPIIIIGNVYGENYAKITESKIEVNETMMTMTMASECGDTQKLVNKCFKDFPPHLMEFLQTKIAIDATEITSKCTVFNRGMKCFDDYTRRCLSDNKLYIFKNNVEGARNFFMKFCNDQEFQKDYLRHKDCFSYIQQDWKRCTMRFQSILNEELHHEERNVTTKFMEFCCARHAFEKCIYNSARYKCYNHSASFARDTARMLSDEKHFSNCRQYEVALCSAERILGLCACFHCLLLLLLLSFKYAFHL